MCLLKPTNMVKYLGFLHKHPEIILVFFIFWCSIFMKFMYPCYICLLNVFGRFPSFSVLWNNILKIRTLCSPKGFGRIPLWNLMDVTLSFRVVPRSSFLLIFLEVRCLSFLLQLRSTLDKLYFTMKWSILPGFANTLHGSVPSS